MDIWSNNIHINILLHVKRFVHLYIVEKAIQGNENDKNILGMLHLDSNDETV